MKRFTETTKWADPWFRKLSPELKLLWQWLLDNCDHAGVIEPDLELASFQIGYVYPIDSLSKLGDRLSQIDSNKWFISKFISFQYGELSPDCKGHRPVFQSLEKHQIKGIERVSIPPKTGQGLDKTGQGQEGIAKGVKLDELFEQFWNEYPRKVGKLDAEKAWLKIKSPVETLPQILSAIRQQKQTDQWRKDGGQFIPHPSTWLNQGRWLDQATPPKNPGAMNLPSAPQQRMMPGTGNL